MGEPGPPPITVLVTGGGAPGIAGTIASLRRNEDRRTVRIVAVDARPEATATFLADAFYRVPLPEEPERFLQAIQEICRRERADVILPQVTRELPVLAASRAKLRRKGIRVAVSSPTTLRRANDKARLHQTAKAAGCSVPPFRVVSSRRALLEAIHDLGYPRTEIAIKPPISNGMRGFRVISTRHDPFLQWRDEKPGSTFLTLERFLEIFEGRSLPRLLVTPYLPGPEQTVDVLASRGETLALVVRRREEIRTGITFRAVVERDARVARQVRALVRALELEYAGGFQFKADDRNAPRLLECNPRIQGTMAASTWAGVNVIYGAVKLALGEPVRLAEPRIGTVLQRYWGGVASRNGRVLGSF